MQNHWQTIVIGAGISGLTAAYRLKTLGVDVLLVEGSGAPGGVIRSQSTGDYLVERGPNSVQATAPFLSLVEELGISDKLVEGDPKAPAFVYFKGSLHPVPRGPAALISTDLLSVSAKLALLAEPFKAKRQSGAEESVSSFFGRRLGKEVAERLAGPFMSGIYAGDPDRLSIQAAFPALAELESEHGSLLRGGIARMRKAKSASKESPPAAAPSRRRRSCSFSAGMEVLPEALASCLGKELWLNSKVSELRAAAKPITAGEEDRPERFEIKLDGCDKADRLTSETLVIATPSIAAADLLAPISEELGQLLREIEYPPLAIVSVAYDTALIKESLKGFGFLVAPGEDLNILGCVYNSNLFPERAPVGKVLLTCFVGGARKPLLARRKDPELSALVHTDLKKILGISGEPTVVSVTRYERSIPQYNIGHADRVRRIDGLVGGIRGLWLTGNYLHGVSTPDCIKEADRVARSLVEIQVR